MNIKRNNVVIGPMKNCCDASWHCYNPWIALCRKEITHINETLNVANVIDMNLDSDKRECQLMWVRLRNSRKIDES
jgi:hypothetical protein